MENEPVLSEEGSRREREFHELSGAIAAIEALQEILELRLNEARDDCVREALDNVIALVTAHGLEYQQRRHELKIAGSEPGKNQ